MKNFLMFIAFLFFITNTSLLAGEIFDNIEMTGSINGGAHFYNKDSPVEHNDFSFAGLSYAMKFKYADENFIGFKQGFTTESSIAGGKDYISDAFFNALYNANRFEDFTIGYGIHQAVKGFGKIHWRTKDVSIIESKYYRIADDIGPYFFAAYKVVLKKRFGLEASINYLPGLFRIDDNFSPVYSHIIFLDIGAGIFAK